MTVVEDENVKEWQERLIGGRCSNQDEAQTSPRPRESWMERSKRNPTLFPKERKPDSAHAARQRSTLIGEQLFRLARGTTAVNPPASAHL